MQRMNTMLGVFDPLDLKDPFPFYEWAREHAPVFYDRHSDCWIVSTYADVRASLADNARFSAEAERLSYAGLSEASAAILRPISFEQLFGLSTTENPDHDRVKRVVFPLFNDLFLRFMKPCLERLARAYLDNIRDAHEVNLVASFFQEFPAEALMTIMGVPATDVPRVKQWSHSRLALTWGEAHDQVYHARNVVEYWHYCQELVERKMVEPKEDLPSALGSSVRDGVLSMHDAQLFCYGLFFSGHATTSAFLAESLHLLLSTGTWQHLAAAGGSCASTADELLRLCPSAFTRRRLALEDVVIHGQEIPAGATILLVIGSANRDPTVFSDPNRLDVDRANANKHLSFGHGFHYCIGARIVRLEYATVMDALMSRFPLLKLAPDFHPTYARNLSIRGPVALPVLLR